MVFIYLGIYLTGCIVALLVFLFGASPPPERYEMSVAGDFPVADAGVLAGLRLGQIFLKMEAAAS